MAYGDAAASLVGRRFGRHVYRVAGHPRSVEGSAAMWLVSWAAVLVAFWTFGRSPDPGLWIAAGIVAVVAAALEAVSLFGFDNLLVPLGAAGVLALLRGPLWS
jgi:phytol kinase